MSRIVFQIGRESPWYRTPWLSNIPGLSYVTGDSLKKALSDSCVVSLEVDGQTVVDQRKTGWGQALAPADLLGFLARYREKPGSTSPQQNIREGLHNFLSAQGVLDEQVAKVLAGDIGASQRSEILIRGDSSSLPLILNVPWELADAGEMSPRRSVDLMGTLAAFPLARVVTNTPTQLIMAPERLRVLYCISQPEDQDPIDADEFHGAIKDVLKARSGMLSYDAVINGNFTPTFNHLKAGIGRTRPHILVIACHGQTVNGVPELCFEKWHPVSSLAEALAQTAKTFLVLLIACDQTHLDETPSAHSGAVTLLEKGILSVVAMQSSVDALLANEFLGTTLDSFFENGSIPLSVAEGRKIMAPGPADANRIVDWSFPALFLSEDAPQHIDKLERMVSAYFPTLDEMLRRIPRPKGYLERPEIDEKLLEFLKVGVAGLREVIGAAHNGKTTAILNASRRALEGTIERKDTSTRAVLYVDFGRYTDTPQTARGLMEILRNQTAEIQSSAGGTPLLTWTVARGADGNGATLDSPGQLITLIDQNRMVLILDNLEQLDQAFWMEFFERARSLSDSLVITLRETNEPGDIEIPPFTQDEVAEYVKRFAPSHVEAAREWHELSGGVAGQLDLLRISGGEREAVSMNAAFFTRGLSAAERDILYILANLPNGVDSELASSFVTPDWRDLLMLSQKGLLLRESRFGIKSSWFRLRQLPMRSLQDDLQETAIGATSLAERFSKQIASADSKEVLINLASKAGRIDFIQDVHQTLLNVEAFDAARLVPLLLHEWLLSRGRWYDAFRLWERLLSTAPLKDSAPHEWLKFAKVAHILGFSKRAQEVLDSITNSDEKELTTIDKIDNRLQRVLIIKDLGYIQEADNVTAEFESILATIEAEKAALSASQDDEARFLEGKYALAIYDRAPHRRYWLRDLPGALSDLNEAGLIFGRLNNLRMKAMADCLWVDVQLDWRDHQKNWAEMFERLVKANEFLQSVEGAAGDSAFCYYQMARYYRRKPFSTPDESKENIAAARTAYQSAAEQAQIAGDTRQEEIAEGHFVEVSLELGLMDPSAATNRLRRVINILNTYKEDAWSIRVVRDMSLLLAKLARKADPNNAMAAYKNAWDAANQAPLHPSHGKDSRRAAGILTEYLEELEKNDQKLGADTISIIAKDLIEEWLGHEIDPSKPQEWIDEVRQYSAG